MDIDFQDCTFQSKYNEECSDSKNKSLEKGSLEIKEKERHIYEDDKDTMKDIFDSNGHKHFDYDTLNRDLADIEERLRQTRQSWNKNSRSSIPEISDIGVRKSLSMLDIERKTYSSASSNADLEKYEREKLDGESPAISESLLKWDYGADIGLNQDDSDEMEPITWPVTAEEALRNEKDAVNRRMKQSLSQGSFLASPDPDDKHNLINKVSEEYKFKSGSFFQTLHSNRRHYHSVSTLHTGKYDDISAKEIMEQAELAEKRLRERLEAVKAVHLNGKYDSREIIKDDTTSVIKGEESSRKLSDPGNKSLKEDRSPEPMVNVSNKKTDEFIPENNGSNVAEDRSRSPTSVTNTGRTTTIESTHSFSDYGKAPVFQPEAYGSRTDYSKEVSGSMYAKRNKDKFVDRGRTVCGMAPELDTISSRETLQITDEKKENSLIREDDCGRTLMTKERQENGGHDCTNNIRNDVQHDDNLQGKWDRFKSMRRDEEHDQLYEKTVLRSASQYNPQNSHRQYSSATTFTTITNVSPRYDSFATDTLRSPLRENPFRDSVPENYEGSEDHRPKRPSEKIPPKDEKRMRETRRIEPRQNSNPRSRRTIGGSGAGRDDEDEDDEEEDEEEKRRIRHNGDQKRSKKKKYGSGQLDGETTASELEHDDAVKCRQRSKDQAGRCKQLSQMLTDLSRRGAAEEAIIDVSDRSDSTSVDTINLMNRMSKLLGKQPKDGSIKVVPSQQRIHEQVLNDNKPYQHKRTSNKNNTTKITESDDGMLVLKHLMLKQKVKWLADCAREEARRRKVKKLQKLIDMYEQGDRVIVPSDLETDTATLMGSDRGSQNDLESQTDSYSQFDEVTPVEYKTQPQVCDDVKAKKGRSRSHNLTDKRPQESQHTSKKKKLPASESWNIPLRENYANSSGDVNASNWVDGNTSNAQKRPMQRYRSPCSRAESSYQEQTVNLSAKERTRIKYELEMARQKNAHECQKDMRHMRTGNVKVASSGLAWAIGSSYDDQDENVRRMSQTNGTENVKEKGTIKSELQMAFENSMENFISRSRQRQKRIKLASDDRRYESQMNMERAKLFVNSAGSNNGVSKRRPVTCPDPLSENLYKPRRRKLSKKDMKVQSAKRYQALPEVQAKYVDERRKARIQSNRMRMQLYSEKILQSLLRNRGPWVSECR